MALGWQLAGLMLIGAALMRSGWLKGEFSVQHYRRSAALLLTMGWLIAVPGIAAQWLLDWEFRRSGFLLQLPRDLASPFISLGYGRTVLWFLAANRSYANQSRYSVRRPNGTEQLPVTDPDLHHVILSL